MSHSKSIDENKPLEGNRRLIYTIIFEAETPSGKFFDVLLLWFILFSIFTITMESVQSVRERFGMTLRVLEWVFTILFSLEYILRMYSSRFPLRYIFSFYGAIDLLSIIPTFLSLFFYETHYLLILRSIRLMRIFRILKLTRFVKEGHLLIHAIRASLYKITVFLGFVMSLVLILGTIMYLVEGEKNGFTSIPVSIYWAIVTITTVGYGDISPKTIPGQFIASIAMVLGYCIIAIPTGIVTSELYQVNVEEARICNRCFLQKHDKDANYCKRCGFVLKEDKNFKSE